MAECDLIVPHSQITCGGEGTEQRRVAERGEREYRAREGRGDGWSRGEGKRGAEGVAGRGEEMGKA